MYDAVQCTRYLTDTPGRFLVYVWSDGVLRTMDKLLCNYVEYVKGKQYKYVNMQHILI